LCLSLPANSQHHPVRRQFGNCFSIRDQRIGPAAQIDQVMPIGKCSHYGCTDSKNQSVGISLPTPLALASE
jgi:hypothetical protein